MVKRDSQKGFTLLELLIVVTIIGILAALAVVNVRNAQRKAAENVLRGNLANLRKAIDDFYADKQRYPGSLQEIVDERYMRKIPPDPITKSADTWVEITEDPLDDLGSSDFSSDFGEGGAGQPGVIDVKSGAEGTTLDGIEYSEL